MVPGDPEPGAYAVTTIKRLMGRQTDIRNGAWGISSLGIALGGRGPISKIRHHGGNHPVKAVKTAKIEITAPQPHLAVDPDSLPQKRSRATHMDLTTRHWKACAHPQPGHCSSRPVTHPRGLARPARFAYLFKDFLK